MDFILIDGNSLINRAFYATPPLNAPDGRPTNAVYAFLNMLFKLEADLKPKYMLVAFDRKEPTFRHKVYSEYKAGRKPMPEELALQIPILKEVLDSMGIARYEQAGFEADDIIGTLAKKYTMSTAIITGDRDSFQLVDQTTSVYFTRRGITDLDVYDNDNFKEKYGVMPNQVVELKSCMGDSSDNIKGIDGVGEKTALTLISTYGNLENLYEHTDELKGKLKERVETCKEQAFFSRQLATIKTDMDIPLSQDDLSLKPYTAQTSKKFLELGFSTLIKKLNVETPLEEVEIVKFNNIKNLLDTLKNIDKLSFIFTPTGIAFSNGKAEFRADFTQSFLDEGISVFDLPDILNAVFKSGKKLILFDKKACKKKLDYNNIEWDMVGDDLSILKYLVDFSGKVATIGDIATQYGKNENAPAHAVYTVFIKLWEKLEEQGMVKLYTDLELPLCNVLYEMERDGFKIDVKLLDALSAEYDVKLREILSKIYFYTGEININSPHQLSQVLFEQLGLKGGKKLKRGGYSTNADVLEKLVDEHPVIGLILDYRKIAKLKSTYVDGMRVYIRPEDQIVHTNFNQTLTSTGRLSSSEPNLQNLPVRSEEGKELRKMFVSRFDGGKIVSCDYSQIELRLLADFSECKGLIQAFKNGEDVHASTASQVFNVPLDKVTAQERRNAKAVNFGIIYGISAFGLSENIKVSPKQAGFYIDKYFEHYPEVKAYMDSNVEFARANGYVSTMLGRKRYIKEINATDRVLRGFGERAAMNMPLQGSSADIIKVAMIRVANRIKKENLKSRLILQIHDELVIDAHPDEQDRVMKLLKEEMEGVKTLNNYVLLEAQVSGGDNLYEAK